jgi:hypothetical protein
MRKKVRRRARVELNRARPMRPVISPTKEAVPGKEALASMKRKKAVAKRGMRVATPRK